MSSSPDPFKTRCEIAGWVLFIISACGFIASSWRSGDTPSLIGGVFFLVACFVFLLPYVRRG